MENEIRSAAWKLLDLLREKNLKIAFAESISGGLLSGNLARIPGASSALLGGLVCYDARVKHRLLNIPEELIRKNGAESVETTRAMAAGLQAAFPDADILVSITGSASPSVNDYRISSPPGSIFLCFGMAGQTIQCCSAVFSGDREEVLNQTILFTYSKISEFILAS
jgi:PncC family amidohydrolase